ncbi:hypothetical protein V6N13_064907 [Hibiscus sabdariffa]
MYTYSRAALALLESVKLDVIIVADISAGVKILAGIGSRAKIPIIALFAAAPSLSFSERTYLIRIGEHESSQAKGIATVVQAFSWRSVILIYEDIMILQEKSFLIWSLLLKRPMLVLPCILPF